MANRGRTLFTLGLVCSALISCSEASFQSARAITEEQAAVESGDATATRSNGSGDATASATDRIPAVVETTALDSSKKPDTIINSFKAGMTKDASYRFSLGPRSVTTDFSLEDMLDPRKDSFTQLSRNPMTDNFTQGNVGQPVLEKFDQIGRKGLVDILVVVDNSGSMKEEQVNLSSKLNELLASIKDANWQVSILTTSPSAGFGVNLNSALSEGLELCNTTLIKNGEVDASDKFAKAVNAGISGNGNEQGIRQAVVGLRCTEKPWLRPSATLAVLIVSDEDNCSSDGSDCSNLPWSKESYLTNYVENTLKRTIGKNAGFYGIVAPSKALCSTAGNAAPQYLRLFGYKANGAVNYGNICDASYKTTLNRISDSIALLLDAQFELKSKPDNSSLKLTLQAADGSTKPLDPTTYTRTDKVITFLPGKEPPAGSKVLVDYVVGAQPILTQFTLSQEPAAGTVIAKVNGAMAPAASYTVAGRVVSFAQAPVDMAAITLDYRQNTALLDRFKPLTTPVTGSVKVSVNGQAISAFTYDAAKNEVVLSTSPADGQTVEIAYSMRTGPRLMYTLPVSKDGRNIKILDGTTPVSFTQSANSFTIGVDVHQVGKILTLSYDMPDSGTKAFEIGRMPVPGSADIISGAGACNLGTGFDILDDKLISSCALTSTMDFTLVYKYIEAQKVFKMLGIDHPERGTWAVYIDGELTRDYVRSGTSITLNAEPAVDARIDIHYTFPE